MRTIDEILDLTRGADDIISDLKRKQIKVPSWEHLVTEYDPTRHEIVNDHVTRIDKTDAKGNVIKAARLTYGQQKLAARRMTQLATTIPVKRVYNTGKDQVLKDIANAIENIYKKNYIDALNSRRFKAYFASCEIVTLWYTVKDANKDYGFNSNYKLRCRTYSPMDTKNSRLDQAGLYPLFDDYGDMIALSLEFKKINADNLEVYYFECYTKDKHLVWRKEDAVWQLLSEPEAINIGKIGGIYGYRPLPIWEGLTNNTKEIEYTLSRESDILRKNSAPVLLISGNLAPTSKAPEGDTAREVYNLTGDGGDIRYVTWQQQVDATKFHVETLKNNAEEELQLPNLSLENVKGLGSGASGEARKTLLADAHLKVGEEKWDLIEFLGREFNVIKAFLAQMNTAWQSKLEELTCEHIITAFIQNDEDAQVKRAVSATGGKAVSSVRTMVKQLGYVEEDAVDEEIKEIENDEVRLNSLNVTTAY